MLIGRMSDRTLRIVSTESSLLKDTRMVLSPKDLSSRIKWVSYSLSSRFRSDEKGILLYLIIPEVHPQ